MSATIACLITLLDVTSAAASDTKEVECAEPRYDGPGGPELARRFTMSCAFVTTRDTITVYSRSAGLRRAQRWQDAVSFEDEIWIFDTRSTGRASLIVDYHRDDGALLADLYEDQDGDGWVSYVEESELPRITELPRYAPGVRRWAGEQADRAQPSFVPLTDLPPSSREPRWSVRVVARDGRWWNSDGTPSMNLDLLVDGPIAAAWASDRYHNQLQTDGQVDFVTQVRDPDGDGRPDYEIRQAYPSISESSGVTRTTLQAAPRPDSIPITGSILWPYLGRSRPGRAQLTGEGTVPPLAGSQETYGYVRDYGKRFPPIQIDWDLGRIVFLSEFVPSRSGDSNWFIYSLNRVDSAGHPDADFENPFAFYDLAADHDGFPELQVRLEYTTPFDRFGPNPRFQEPTAIVRYSWDQDNNRSWDFKVDLLGRHPLDTLVQLPELSVKTVPYERLPGWVTSQSWDAATFVALERDDYWTSEGIYEWSTGAFRDVYMRGLRPTKAVLDTIGDVSSLQPGMRGEFQESLESQPWLYVSSVDRKLHLLGARSGLYNVDGTASVRYADLDGDGHIDQWRFFTGQQDQPPLRELDLALGQVVYGADETVVLKSAPADPAIFKTLPPTNHDEWLQLGERLRSTGAAFEASDLPAMLAALPGPELRIERATIRDLRIEPQSFRFVLDLEPGFGVTRVAAATPWLADLTVGSNVVTYSSAHGYRAQPLTPAQLAFTSLTVEPTPAEVVWPLKIHATLANLGNEDQTNVQVQFRAEQPGRAAVTIGQVTVDTRGEDTVDAALNWTALSAGDWWLTATASQADRELASAVVVVVVAAPRVVDLDTLLTLAGLGGLNRGAVGLVLLAATTLAAGLGLAVWRDRGAVAQREHRGRA